MKLTQLLGFVVAMIALHGSVAAQAGRVDISEGTHFEVAFAHVWPSPTEKPTSTPVTLLLTARTAAVATVEFDSLGVRASRMYDLQAGVTRIVILTTAIALPVPTVGIERKGITVRSTGPITVATNLAWQGNGNATLHYPITTWGMSYRAFSHPQDEYSTSPNLKVRPGQMVFIASEDDTRITFNAPTPIESAPGLPSAMVANTSYTITLNAHETVTLLAKTQTGESHQRGTDLTGTLITSTKPIAVISGHTKGTVSMTHPRLPPTGAAAAEAHFVRNGYNQVLLPDYLADTAFVTVPLKYKVERVRTVFDEDTVNWAGDVVRILATVDNTIVRRLRVTGLAYDVVATLNAGQYYTDLSAKRVCVWKTSQPAHVMQYGKSYAKGPTASIEDIKSDYSDKPQGHPTVQVWMPTMIVIPGTSHWISRGTFVSQPGMDTYCSVVVPTANIQDIMLDGKALMSFPMATRTDLVGTAYTSVVLPVAETMHTIKSTVPSVLFMAWNYGSLFGLSQGRSYGHPIALGVARPCTDTITVVADTSGKRATVTASLSSATSCSNFLGYEIISAKNVVVDSSDVELATMNVYVSRVRSDTMGTITLRIISTSGSTVDHTVSIDSVTRPSYRLDLEIHTTNGSIGQLCTNAFITTTAIPDQFVSCMAILRYKDSVLIPRTTRVDAQDVRSNGLRTSRFKFPLGSKLPGAAVANIDFLVAAGNSADWPFEVVGFSWYDTDSVIQNVDTRFTRIITPPPVSVSDDNTSKPTALGLSIRPQPAIDVVVIRYRKGLEGGSLRLFDYTGTLVMELSDKLVANTGEIAVDTKALARGVYVLRLTNGHDTFVERFVVD